jgi:hypothetical protein
VFEWVSLTKALFKLAGLLSLHNPREGCRSEQQCEERSSFITWYPNEFLNTLHISKSTKHTVVALQEANMSGHDMYLYYTVPCKRFCKRLSGRDCPLSFKFTFLLLFPSWVSSFGVKVDAWAHGSRENIRDPNAL